jgi:hypothetical protein
MEGREGSGLSSPPSSPAQSRPFCTPGRGLLVGGGVFVCAFQELSCVSPEIGQGSLMEVLIA